MTKVIGDSMTFSVTGPIVIFKSLFCKTSFTQSDKI